MLFNSLQFFLFFLLVYGLYLVLSHRAQNRLLLAASFLFYGAWDFRFLPLFAGSCLMNYAGGLWVHRLDDPRRRKRALVVTMAANLLLLGFFKYFNFLTGSGYSLLQALGVPVTAWRLDVILPMGISFYTFQAMSYVIDVYRRELEPCRSAGDFSLYVAFFPQLVAGPIERATHLLPQVLAPRTVDRYGLIHGGYLILYGLFQKLVVADHLAVTVDYFFNKPEAPAGVPALLALYAFAFQIYCDFAGYSNIARGLAHLMGFRIMANFRTPYFAANPAEFWHRWHISLSTWLRDYLYIPLGGSRGGARGTYRNLALTMLLGGLWHGAAWNFVFWGAYQGAMLIIHRLLAPFLRLPARTPRVLAAAGRAVTVFVFFHLVCLGWLLFRARSAGQIGAWLTALVTDFHAPDAALVKHLLVRLALFAGPLLVLDFAQYRSDDPYVLFKWPLWARVLVMLFLVYALLLFGYNRAQSFIYFQF